MFAYQLAFSQGSSIIIRHMEGIKAIKIGQAFMFGDEKQTLTTSLGYNQYFSKKFFADASINIEYGKIQDTKIKNLFLRLNGNYSIFSVNNTLFFNVAGGIFGGLDIYESNIVGDKDKKAKVGGDLGLTTEIYLSNAICIEPFFYQYFQTPTDLGSSFYNFGLNIKYNF